MNTQNTAPAENKDFLADGLTKAVRFCKQNRKPVITALALVVLIIVGVSLYVNHTRQVTEDSWAAYYNAQLALVSQGEEAGFAQLDQLSADFKGTPAAAYAQLLKANLLYAQENFAQAATIYKELANHKNETVRTEAALSHAAALQAAKDYNGSIQAAKSFIEKNSKSFARPQAYLTLAMSQELAGDKSAALESYKYLLENYTKTYFGTLAKDKISQLQK
ncbi:MAG: tetratricopeptide repeat protein [Elusimicrobiaceae bacterium]|nr:tetratricopeptide repeat protein [Elusimicrobiaceae bacterium]